MQISLISITSIRFFSRPDHWSHSSGMIPRSPETMSLYLLLSMSMLMGLRDPWWVFTTVSLFWTIKRQYGFQLWELIIVSPRFGIMLASMCLSIAFIVVDTCSVLNVFNHSELPTGVEPFWKVRTSPILQYLGHRESFQILCSIYLAYSFLIDFTIQLSFIFKCLCDTVILDDFKTALDRLRNYWLRKQTSGEILLSGPMSGQSPASRVAERSDDVETGQGHIVTHKLVRTDKAFSLPRVFVNRRNDR